MYNTQAQDTHFSILSYLVFLFPIIILGRYSWGSYVLILLALIGAYIAITHSINPFAHRQLKLLSIITTAYFFSIIFFIFRSDNSTELLMLSGGEVYYLLAPLIAISIYKSNFDLERFVLAIKLGLCVLGAVVLYRSTEITITTDRVLWVSHIGTMLLVFSWININRESKYALLLTFVSSSLAINAIILAGTRGPIITFVILSIIFLYMNHHYSDSKSRSAIFAVTLILVSTVLLVINDNSQKRFNDAATNLLEWSASPSHELEENMNTSSGQRMEMYKAGLLAAKQKPILGYGYKNTTHPAAEYVDDNIKDQILQHTHLHNTYIDSLVYGGVIALIIVIAMLLIPFVVFWRTLKNRNNTEYAVLGILLISAYTLLGITDTMIGGIYENIFYVFFLSLLLPRAINKKNTVS